MENFEENYCCPNIDCPSNCCGVESNKRSITFRKEDEIITCNVCGYNIKIFDNIERGELLREGLEEYI